MTRRRLIQLGISSPLAAGSIPLIGCAGRDGPIAPEGLTPLPRQASVTIAGPLARPVPSTGRAGRILPLPNGGIEGRPTTLLSLTPAASRDERYVEALDLVARSLIGSGAASVRVLTQGPIDSRIWPRPGPPRRRRERQVRRPRLFLELASRRRELPVRRRLGPVRQGIHLARDGHRAGDPRRRRRLGRLLTKAGKRAGRGVLVIWAGPVGPGRRFPNRGPGALT